ncbi:GTP-binding protein Era [Metamycoplasma hyosynoviae]|uniref:GTPase Era n=1 Tax=Metamycoplasma hyosynoviae TaxID=29559 RepID=A0A063YKQ3_9BACT|nr:GTPase Era [Metamycoplasma hyosynoviae]KDE41550.1 GTP-binding protein Era [Metamycoplasma hyosynoviae]KDE42997.1 GTP-binding protein Era [Metamycoplasma hyosynoviae]KDE43370.1 GTP-binding protein Era [Metamycoplasma hyosynoviae]KDE43588.1 GTP-binding protein Era [Metamycoplasma hyosynoviae]KDE45101.1 GTP-binding protein Era [Metamycoplasma hyosynoviae]
MKKIVIASLIGRPNVGKSTLMNNLIKWELSIISPFVQTTRDEIRGIYNDENSQIIFIDTPGIHKSVNKFSEKLNSKAYENLKNVDVILFLTAANEEIGKGDQYIIDKLKEVKDIPKIAVITKLDLENNEEVIKEKVNKLKKLGFEKVFGVGLKFEQAYKDLIEEIKNYGNEGELLYDESYITDVPMTFIAKEVIRENAVRNLYEDLPHSIAIKIDEFIEEPTIYKILATLYVKRNSQKAIIIGKDASVIKDISIRSRKKLRQIFDRNVYINISVKVMPNWVNNDDDIKKLGY